MTCQMVCIYYPVLKKSMLRTLIWGFIFAISLLRYFLIQSGAPESRNTGHLHKLIKSRKLGMLAYLIK